MADFAVRSFPHVSRLVLLGTLLIVPITPVDWRLVNSDHCGQIFTLDSQRLTSPNLSKHAVQGSYLQPVSLSFPLWVYYLD